MFLINLSRIVPYVSGSALFVKAIRAMSATAFATIPSLEMIQFGKDLISLLTVVKIFRFQFIIVKLHQQFCFDFS